MTEKKTCDGIESAQSRMRKQAEAIELDRVAHLEGSVAAMSPEQVKAALHELRVHQIELEMQNEELRKIQLELEDSRAQYFDLYDLSPVSYLTVSEQGIVLLANLTAVTLLGETMRNALVNRPLSQYIHKDDLDIYYLQSRQLFANSKPQTSELRMLKKDGTVFWARLHAIVAQGTDGVRVSRVVITDITESRRSAQALQRANDRLVESLDKLIEGCQIIGFDWRFLYINDAAARQGRRAKTDFVGRTMMEVLPGIEHTGLFSILKRCLDERIAHRMENEFTYYDGGRGWFELSIQPVQEGIFILSIDITESKRVKAMEKDLGEKLERAARMESLGVLAGGVAHDLNNVLGPMVVLPDMVTEYVKRHEDLADPEYSDTVESLRTMKDSALRAASVVSDLVLLGRRGQILKTPMDVNRVVDRMMASTQVRAMTERWPYVHIVTKLTNQSLWCAGSESRLFRVLVNLVGNAVEAVEGVGDVTVRTCWKVFTEPYHGYDNVPAGVYTVIEVTDTGCGMDGKIIARIFEPFFSTKASSERSGSGLGLSVVYGLVKDHDGFLDVKSEPGKGAAFTVYLPAVDQAAEPAAKATAFVQGGSERVLVVDDEPGQQVLARRALRKLGYEVTVVSSGEEAVKLFEEAGWAGKPSPFDIVLTDMVMDGMDGMSLCRKIPQLYPGQKLVIASGHSAQEKEQQSRGMGADWLVKPYTAESLARTVRTRLDR